jgi:ABC-type uncharacterized transport system permease subunit
MLAATVAVATVSWFCLETALLGLAGRHQGEAPKATPAAAPSGS